MSHYIAERLATLETLADEDRERAREELASLVVRLWSSRQGAPFRTDPLGSVEAVERAIERLDPKRPAWAYYQPFRQESEPSGAQTAVLRPLELALHLDQAVRDLIHDLIAYAALIATSEDADWLASVRAAGQYPDRQLRNLERIMEGNAVADDPASAADGLSRDIASNAESCIELMRSVREMAENTPPETATRD